ncbi:Hypothetical predicted protein [Mytilus galloprovincialis]|uniref:Death domain-containing protein n=1 Tax=Mytilus galloprovincialis TaxID=29158 RepID=A0A8B6DWF2_MYTGA|nr:Hypothetical predicted protein [Mytilus galloprovincialis]
MFFKSCLGLSEDALSQIPSNSELLRLSVNCETCMLHDLALHLGMEEMVWNDMEYNNPGNTQLVKFLTLMHLKENDEITFTELDNGLREMEITTHKLCVVRRRKQVKSNIPDDILDCVPSDEILDRLAPLVGKIVFQLGIELGLSVEDLESIKEKWERDLTAQNKEVLFTWRKGRTVKPTIRVLEQVLVDIGKGARCLKEVVKDVDPKTLRAVEMVTDLSDWNFPLYKVRLQKNYLKIITNIQHENIVDHLIARQVVSVDDGKKIESGKTPQEKNRNLMDMMLRKNEMGFYEFIKALRKDSVYADLADQIEKTDVTSRDMATLRKCLK